VFFYEVFKAHQNRNSHEPRNAKGPYPDSFSSVDTFNPCSDVIQSILPIFKMYSDLCKYQATTSLFFSTGI